MPSRFSVSALLHDRDDQALAVGELDREPEVDEVARHDLVAAQLAVDPRVVAERLDRRARDEREVRRVDAVRALVLLLAASRGSRRPSTCRPRSRDVTCADVSSERRMCSAMPRRIAVTGSKRLAGRPLGSGRLARRRGGCRLGGCGAGFGAGGGSRRGLWRLRAGARPREPEPRARRRRPRRTRGCPSSSRGRRGRCPATWLGSMPCSLAMRATTGETNALPFPAAPRVGAVVSVGAASGCSVASPTSTPSLAAAFAASAAACVAGSGAARGRRGSAGAAAADAPTSPPMRASSVPTSTVSPSWTRISLTTPLRGRRHLGVDLVGRDLEQRLVGLDLLADLLQPLRDRPLGDGDAHLRHDDVDCGSGGHDSS